MAEHLTVSQAGRHASVPETSHILSILLWKEFRMRHQFDAAYNLCLLLVNLKRQKQSEEATSTFFVIVAQMLNQCWFQPQQNLFDGGKQRNFFCVGRDIIAFPVMKIYNYSLISIIVEL